MNPFQEADHYGRVIDILEAQDRLEELIEELKPGESFLISVNGRPKVRVLALWPEEAAALANDSIDETTKSRNSEAAEKTGPAEADPVDS